MVRDSCLAGTAPSVAAPALGSAVRASGVAVVACAARAPTGHGPAVRPAANGVVNAATVAVQSTYLTMARM